MLNAFHHEIGMPDEIFPKQWMDLSWGVSVKCSWARTCYGRYPNSPQSLVKTIHRFAWQGWLPVYLGYPKQKTGPSFGMLHSRLYVEFELQDSEDTTMLTVCHIRSWWFMSMHFLLINHDSQKPNAKLKWSQSSLHFVKKSGWNGHWKWSLLWITRVCF